MVVCGSPSFRGGFHGSNITPLPKHSQEFLQKCFAVPQQIPLDLGYLGQNTSSSECQTEYTDLHFQVVPGRVLSMNIKLLVGDPVRITSGVYAGAEGIIEDLQPECSAVRVHTKAGKVYGYLEAIEKIVPPMRALKGNALKK
jgi:hypothetical protein